MQIVKLEDVVLQNNCFFVYDQLKKRSSITFDNYFRKLLQITIVIVREVKNLKYLLPKLQPMVFNQIHQVR